MSRECPCCGSLDTVQLGMYDRDGDDNEDYVEIRREHTCRYCDCNFDSITVSNTRDVIIDHGEECKCCEE